MVQSYVAILSPKYVSVKFSFGLDLTPLPLPDNILVFVYPVGGVAKWPKATDCKSVIVGSNPTAA